MSKLNPASAWYPPEFPEIGRLPTEKSVIGKNCKQHDSLDIQHHDALCAAANRRVAPPCCKTLHISLFFDGTGNNLNHDLFESTPPHPTNIARLFRATIGQGYAGGSRAHTAELVDQEGSAGNQYYKYYMPGVGTPFPEVMDLDFSDEGLKYATGGEERINWALLRLIDALRQTLGLNKLSDNENWLAVQSMATTHTEAKVSGEYRRHTAFFRLLNGLGKTLHVALTQPEPGKPKLLGIKLYVYGFSRGAASARAFVNWLNQLLSPSGAGALLPFCLATEHGEIPVSIEFLGLLDTVASVGIAHIAPVAEGHMSWADGTMELPDNALIKRCVHLVSSHEQRLCFPLDSICRTDGRYPEYAVEVVYPGMHSDVGGGYPPGDQGKACGEKDVLLLSKIALNDMYAAAFATGAPLKVSALALPDDLKANPWRIMPAELIQEFEISPDVIQRFNAWRQLTLNLPPSKTGIPDEQTTHYSPVRADINVIEALERQTGWITAWRIGRYAHGTFRTQNFYRDAAANDQDKDRDPAVRAERERERAKTQKDIERVRIHEISKKQRGEFVLQSTGPKDFDARLGQTQLSEAAIEFKEDYQQIPRTHTKSFTYAALDYFKGFVYAFNQDDMPVEYKKIKAAGEAHLATLFPVQGERHNADAPSGLVRALFDDQVHDSRAWFMHSALGAREPWGSYFLYRMIYFGEATSKQVKPLAMLGYVAGLGYPISTHQINFLIEMIEKPRTPGEPASVEQKISLVDAGTGYPLGVLQDKTRQIPCVNYPATALAECQKVQEMAVEQQKARVLSLFSNER
ncbi:Protein of unknown function DUF2235 [Enterobacter soli]|uniref:T6SS phospholipase effector Tle1-like catalytic domain-containing protein n=1 Tax=Enterobacter soli TaxID=885040 RepID=UPI000223C3F8|nr:DUF2235 domain-containing protein [Enterobacter soli]AEN62785.1 Protein of unknown function DUF2235 [Enterobacter soli]OAT41711.1 hypothetical protein M987_01197 [Enterobacter soli ATCC BAA-2102]